MNGGEQRDSCKAGADGLRARYRSDDERYVLFSFGDALFGQRRLDCVDFKLDERMLLVKFLYEFVERYGDEDAVRDAEPYRLLRSCPRIAERLNIFVGIEQLNRFGVDRVGKFGRFEPLRVANEQILLKLRLQTPQYLAEALSGEISALCRFAHGLRFVCQPETLKAAYVHRVPSNRRAPHFPPDA